MIKKRPPLGKHLKNTDKCALSFVTLGSSAPQETASWPVAASEDWSDLLLQEQHTC